MRLNNTLKEKQKIRLDKKIYKKELKNIQNQYKNKRSISGINKDWKNEWKSIIKYDTDWDMSSYLDLTEFKLQKMKLKLMYEFSHYLAEECITPQIKEIDKALQLAEKIKEDNYLEKWHDFHLRNTLPYIEIRSLGKEDKDIKDDLLRELKREIGKESLIRIQATKEDREKMLSMIDKDNSVALEFSLQQTLKERADEWCANNGYKEYDNVTYLYGTEWDTEKKEQQEMKLMDKATQDRKKDIKNLFEVIANNFDVWGD